MQMISAFHVELRTYCMRIRVVNNDFPSIIFLLNKSVELLEVKEAVADPLLILLFNNEIMCLQPLVLHLLFLVLTHQLSQSTVKLANILREEFSISEYLHEQLLLVLLPDEATLDT